MSTVLEKSTTEKVTVKIHKLPHALEELPFYATSGSAGMDLRAAISEPLTLQPMERQLVPTGLIMLLPEGYECQVRPRSGLSIKHGITLINCVGTIDSDFRHEAKVPVVNLSTEPYTIEPGERIAQAIIAPVTQATWQEVNFEEVEADRQRLDRQGGFGSTGKA